MKINKKASIFAVALVLIAFVSLSYALGSFIFVKNKIKIEATHNSELIEAYNQETKDTQYNEELLKLQAQQKFYEIVKEGAISEGDCNTHSEDYIEWNENCKPNSEELKKGFVTQIDKSEIKIIEKKGYVNYKIEYNYNSSASINLEDLGIYAEDFETIYEQAKTCKSNQDIAGCMKLKRWSAKTKKDSGYVLFDVSTKDNFFFEDKFEPIILKFALKQ